jgi:hypothetical protein
MVTSVQRCIVRKIAAIVANVCTYVRVSPHTPPCAFVANSHAGVEVELFFVWLANADNVLDARFAAFLMFLNFRIQKHVGFQKPWNLVDVALPHPSAAVLCTVTAALRRLDPELEVLRCSRCSAVIASTWRALALVSGACSSIARRQ